MPSKGLSEIIEQFDRQGRMSYIEAASSEQITAFEAKNGVVLPDGYKGWLKHSDGGDLFLPAGLQLYGVAHKPVIDVNANDRPDDTYIVIGALCTGDPILCDKNNEQISIYNHEDETIENDETYEDFLAFLRDLPEILGIEE